MGGNLEIMVSKCGMGFSSPLKKTELFEKKKRSPFFLREKSKRFVEEKKLEIVKIEGMHAEEAEKESGKWEEFDQV